MRPQARRRAIRIWDGFARRALLALALVAGGAGLCLADGIASASYGSETDRYPHGVLGDAIEFGRLIVTDSAGRREIFDLPNHLVFEDLAPRLVDLDGDGLSEVVTVESDASAGARLAVYDMTGRIAATPFIGTRFRWLAPIGAADLDGDGHVEIAYVDRPHLAKTLRIWRYRNGRLDQVAAEPGLTNHRIGEDFISGGIRNCGDGAELITVDAGWRYIMASRFDGEAISTREVRPFNGPASFDAALSCG